MEKPRASKLLSAVALAVVGLLSVGCGAYEPEPEYPQGYYPPPPPLSSEELAAQQAQAQGQAQAAPPQEVTVAPEGGDEYADTDPSALTQWRPALEGHGTWVEDPTYGTVWVPASSEVGADFQPYVTAGHWTYADDTSWVWVSDYDWGWVPFHYGRWVHLPGHGWSWIPGRRYAGAWVTWRTGPADYGYIGWAPAPPTWYWYSGVAFGWSFGFYNHHHHYVYCANDYVYHDHMHSYVVRGPSARVHDSQTAEYIPAQPTVNGGGERHLANPSVGGNGRVLAEPGVGGGRVAANPTVARGPRPSEAGIRGDVVVPPPKAHPGLERAQAFGSVRSAVQRGASAPMPARVATASPTMMSASRSAAAFPPARPPMHADGVVRSAPVAPLPPRQSALPDYRSPRSSSSSSYASRPYASPYASRPDPRTAPTPPAVARPRIDPLPSFRSTTPTRPSVAASPSYRSRTWSSPSPSFRSSPSPSFRSSPSPSFRSSPSPSFRSSPSPSFRSSPSPSFRSSPRVSSPRSSGSSIRSGAFGRRR